MRRLKGIAILPVGRTRELSDGKRREWRGSASARGYDRDWTKLRDRYIEANPLCCMCARAGLMVLATEVDHITPVAVAPERRLDPTNLQSLCHPCHGKKTQREDRAQ